MELTKKETINIVIVAFIAAFVFSFNEWGIESFDFSTGLKNLSISFVLCIIVYSIYVLAEKLVARYYEYGISFEILTIEKKIKEVRRIVKIPIGPLVTLFITLASVGKFSFVILNSFKLVPDGELRTGRRWTGVKEFEEAQVALSGPLSLVVLLVIFKTLSPFSQVFEKGMFIASTIMIFNLLPLPKVDGSKIFFGSFPLYVTSLIFSVAFVLLIFYLSIIQTIILALVIALAVGIAYLYKINS